MSSPLTLCITGASSGIGCAVAELFGRKGHRLVLGARRMNRLIEVKQQLEEYCDVEIAELDVRDSNSVREFCSFVTARAPQGLDVLINNAGLALGLAPLAEGVLDDWRTMVETNVIGLLEVTRGLLPAMIQRRFGHIVNVGSVAGHQVYEGGAVYCATKHAVDAITRALRLELNGTSLRVSAIDPGMVETEFSIVRLRDAERAKAVYRGVTPLSGQDVAECIEFMVTRPAHINIDSMLVMPTAQASATKVHRI